MRSIMLIVAAVAVGLASAGCAELARKAIPSVSGNPAPPADAAHLPKTAVNYNDDGADRPADSTVDRALMWSEKYAQAVDRLSRMQQAYHDLGQENKQLRAQTAKMQSELAQSEKELTDANSLLVEMRAELDRWKASVLGYREEMRQAQKAQLEALSKVIVLLGGTEVIEPAPQPADSDTSGDSTKAEHASEKHGA